MENNNSNTPITPIPPTQPPQPQFNQAPSTTPVVNIPPPDTATDYPPEPAYPTIENTTSASPASIDEDDGNIKFRYLLIHVAAAFLCGAIFIDLWLKYVLKLTHGDSGLSCSPSSLICGNGFLSFLAYAAPLFLIVGVLVSVKLSQFKALTAYLYSSITLSSYFLVINYFGFYASSIDKFSWLYLHPNTLVIIAPATVAAVTAGLVLMLQKLPLRHISGLLSLLLIPTIVIAYIVVPGQAKKAVATTKSQTYDSILKEDEQLIKTSDFKVIRPKNYSGPVDFFSGGTAELITDEKNDKKMVYFLAHSEVNSGSYNSYSMFEKNIHPSFNPPKNCGSPEDSTELSIVYACRVVLTTKTGRKVYGYWDPGILKSVGVDINSKEVLQIQPDGFYIVVGSTQLSFSDNWRDLKSQSPITPTVMEDFVDSLQPVADNEIHDFVTNNVLGTKASNGIKD